MGLVTGGLVSAGGSISGTLVGDYANSVFYHQQFTVNVPNLVIVGVAAIAAHGIGKIGGEEFGNWVGSDIGRPATRLSTLWDAFLSPEDHPRAAYQVYSGIMDQEIHAYIDATFYHLI
jgi:hypothetical protein